MVNSPNDLGFVQEISNLDKIRQKAVHSKDGNDKEALTAAARQFEAIFTSMLFKSMRDSNSNFKSDLLSSQNEDFFRQMLDEQRASELSASGSLGLADMIVKQLSAGRGETPEQTGQGLSQDEFDSAMQRVMAYHREQQTGVQAGGEPQEVRLPEARQSEMARHTENPMRLADSAQSVSFKTPESFVASLKPYAEKAAQALGVDSSLLIAQAALETGWGQKVVKNARGSSHNLFNIKADRSWAENKVATQTLEYHDNTPVMEKAAFRSYRNYQDSFDDYVRFLQQNPRYSMALRNNGSDEAFIRSVHHAGYATDPHYADKVLRVKAQIEDMN